MGKRSGGGHGHTEPSSEKEGALSGPGPCDLDSDLVDLGPDPGLDPGDLGPDPGGPGPDPGGPGLGLGPDLGDPDPDLGVFWVCSQGRESPKHDL